MTRPTRLRAIVFDMDGTLIESRTAVPDSYIQTVRALGGPSYTREQVVDAYGVGPPSVLLAHLLGRPASDNEVDAYYERLEANARDVSTYAGVEEALTTLSPLVPLAVYTGASTRACTLLLEFVGLARYLSALVGADEVDRPKPAPDGLLVACRRLDVSPEAVAYVGDSPSDLETARRAGTLAVAAGWGHLFVPGQPADVVARSPGELLQLVDLGPGPN